MRRVVIVGSGGQDGRILFERCAKECAVLGIDVGRVTQHSFDDAASQPAVDVESAEQVSALLERLKPDEVYYLAAHHHSAEESPDAAVELRKSLDVHVVGLVNFLEAMRRVAAPCRLFYAGSSQMFGWPSTPRQDENTPFAPRNVYAITKVAGAQICALYRDEYGVHASVGILFNHESPLRGPRFVSQRIVRGAWRARRDPTSKLKLGSLSSVVDWGFAPDYVDAMTRILSQAVPDDYVIASGQAHTVRDFVESAFRILGMDWRDHVEEAPALVRATQATLVGDTTKLREQTGWRPTVSFDQMVEILVHGARNAC